MTIFPLHVQILTPKRLGVKSTTPTPLNISATMQTCKIFWPRCSVIYTFQSSAYFAAILAKIGHAVPTLFNFLSMLVRQKKWFKNVILCTKSVHIQKDMIMFCGKFCGEKNGFLLNAGTCVFACLGNILFRCAYYLLQ